MTGPQAKLRTAAVVAGAAYLASAPHAAYLAQQSSVRLGGLSADQVLAMDLLRLAVVTVLASLIGAFFSARNGLPDLGGGATLRRAWRWYLGGALWSVGLYFAAGSPLAARFPAQYPCAIGWAVVALIKNSVFEEVIARYGMMTLAVGVLRNKTAGNLVQATFFTLVSLRALPVNSGGWDATTVLAIAAAFLVHLGSGAVYARHGLLAASVFRAATGLRLLIHPAIGC